MGVLGNGQEIDVFGPVIVMEAIIYVSRGDHRRSRTKLPRWWLRGVGAVAVYPGLVLSALIVAFGPNENVQLTFWQSYSVCDVVQYWESSKLP